MDMTAEEILSIILRRKEVVNRPETLTMKEKISWLLEYFDIDEDEIVFNHLLQKLHDEGILSSETKVKCYWEGRISLWS